MYLEFVSDLFHLNDYISIQCGNKTYYGNILKLSNDLIALKQENGKIVIKRDDEITNIGSVEKTNLTSSVDIPKPVNVPKVDSHKVQYNVTVEDNNQDLEVNKNNILNLANDFDNHLSVRELKVLITENAYVKKIFKDTIVVSTDKNQECRIFKKTIITNQLLNDINRFRTGDIIPLVLYKHKNNPQKVVLTLSPTNIAGVVLLLKSSIEEEYYLATKLLCYFLLTYIGHHKAGLFLVSILKQLKNISIFTKPNAVLDQVGTKKEFKISNNNKDIEKRINNLLREGKHQDAIYAIDKALSEDIIDIKYKSSLLLKKAQTYSSLTDYVHAKEAYIDLIAFNETIHSDSKNLSHLYTELARLQSMDKSESENAMLSVKKALSYNKNNTFATTLLSQLQSGGVMSVVELDVRKDDTELILESDESSITISKMIDIDIREHKFTNEDILRNDGKVTPIIAKKIFDTAKATKDVDLSERYPVYLEAAKAFSELPVGSYDSQEYLEAVAYYSILKGDSIFIKFKNAVDHGERNINYLTQLRDSVCSYYIESLNLMSNIPSTRLLSILSNYLKINIALCNIRNNETVNFSGQFDKVFFNCIDSDNCEYNEIAWAVIIAVGTASAGAWNSLVRIKGGTGGLYEKMSNNRNAMYDSINKFGGTKIKNDLKPGEFLKAAFKNRRKLNMDFAKLCNDILKQNVDVHLITTLVDSWKKIGEYVSLLSSTDIESKNAAENFLRILTPYKNRNQAERTNILIQAQRILEKQISFINEITTFYGRIFFFTLFMKWRKSIQSMLDKKIADTLPILQVIADPPYIVSNENKKIVNLVVKNIGDSTAEGCIIIPSVSELNSRKIIKAKNEYNQEIPAGNNLEVSMNLPSQLVDVQKIDLSIGISAIYQGKETEMKVYSFTIESEPKSSIEYSDIPWKDGPIPEEQMFKGRKQILDILKRHYTSLERDKPYILYGLTRTGKSSILRYLKDALEKQKIRSGSDSYTIATFEWDLSQASSFGNAQDFWQYLLYDRVYDHIDDYFESSACNDFSLSVKPRAKDFSSILLFLNKKKIYPLFLVDEFSFIKVLMDNKVVNPAFLHTLRQFSLEGLASFIYAGTYDIKALIKDQKYGITGQLVNAVEEQINEIDEVAAEELMSVMGERLKFSNEAISQLHKLSGDIPYFIQMICKYCGLYAVEKKRSIIGYPELELIIKVLTGERDGEQGSMIMALPENVFQSNMYSPADPKEVNVLITSIAYFNRDNKENPRGVGMVELQELWAKKSIQAFRSKLAEALELLIEKKVLIQYDDEGLPVYKFSVDLFRRWWGQHHTDITREIDTIL